MKKFFLFVTSIVIITSMLTSCLFYKSWFGKRPWDQPNTNWATEDNTITFSIDENGFGTGKIVIDGETVDIHIAKGDAIEIVIDPLENVIGDYVYGDSIEYWAGDFYRSDRFTATVEKTTYFEVGEKLTFYRIDDDSSQTTAGSTSGTTSAAETSPDKTTAKNSAPSKAPTTSMPDKERALTSWTPNYWLPVPFYRQKP